LGDLVKDATFRSARAVNANPPLKMASQTCGAAIDREATSHLRQCSKARFTGLGPVLRTDDSPGKQGAGAHSIDSGFSVNMKTCFVQRHTHVAMMANLKCSERPTVDQAIQWGTILETHQ
jgi:hypothetical protein